MLPFYPPQLFWEKKLSGLSAFDIAEELVRTMDLPKGLQGEPGLPSLAVRNDYSQFPEVESLGRGGPGLSGHTLLT